MDGSAVLGSHHRCATAQCRRCIDFLLFIALSVFEYGQDKEHSPYLGDYLYNMLLDILIGLIPFVGVVGDIFKRAFARNALLIEGYVEGRQAIIREVERKAVWMALLIVLFFFLIYWMIVSVVKLSEWIISFF